MAADTSGKIVRMQHHGIGDHEDTAAAMDAVKGKRCARRASAIMRWSRDTLPWVGSGGLCKSWCGGVGDFLAMRNRHKYGG
jgi:hypothetical protein